MDVERAEGREFVRVRLSRDVVDMGNPSFTLGDLDGCA